MEVATNTRAIVAAIDDAKSELTLTFSNGQVLTVKMADLTAEQRVYAALHGLKQKLVDAAALSRSTVTGHSASIADKYAAVRQVYDRIMSGGWNAPRDGGSAGQGALLERALARLQGKSLEAVRVFLDSKTDAQKRALRVNARVAAEIAAIQAEAAALAGIDSDGLLDELGEFSAPEPEAAIDGGEPAEAAEAELLDEPEAPEAEGAEPEPAPELDPAPAPARRKATRRAATA